MSINFFKRQLASVIEWTDQQIWALLAKYKSDDDEIKNASKLIIGPGQGVILVYEGSITEVFTKEGIYNLETDNYPFITTLLKLRTAFESEHKLKIYFFRTADNVNQNWGTASPIKYVDPVYKFPVELGANGNFSFEIADAKLFFAETAGLADLYTTVQAKNLLQSRIWQVLSSELATAQFSYQQIDAQLGAISEKLKPGLVTEFANIGLSLTDFRINGTIFDAGTQARIAGISNINAESQAASAAGMNYTELEKLRALRDAAKNPGLAGAGLQMGAGIALGKMFADTRDPQAAPEPPSDPMLQLQKLKQLLTEGIITQEEFDAKKKQWLDKL